MTGDSAGLAFLCIFADTGTDYSSADKSRDTAYSMDTSRACKINESKLCKPALTVPYPTGFYRINDKADKSDKNDKTDKTEKTEKSDKK